MNGKYFFIFTLFNLFFISCSQISHKIGAVFSSADKELSNSFYHAIRKENSNGASEVNFEEVSLQIPIDDILVTKKSVCKVMKEGIVAILGPTAPDGVSITRSICEKFQIPHLQFTWKEFASNRLSPFSLNFYPQTNLLSKALGVVFRNMKWKKYVILYENESALIRLKDILEIPNVNDEGVGIIRIEPLSDIRHLFKHFLQSSITKIILDCETDHIIFYLEQGKSVGLFQDVLQGIFLPDLDAHTLDYHEIDIKANITTVRIFDPENDVFKNMQTEWNFINELEEETKNLRTQSALIYDAVMLLTKSLRELDLSEQKLGVSIKCSGSTLWDGGAALISHMKTNGLENALTGPMSFNEYGQRVNFSVEVIEIVDEKKDIIASWSPDLPNSLLFLKSNEDFESRIFSFFADRTLIVSSRFGKPYLVNSTDEEGNPMLEGFCYDLMWSIADYLNFSIKFIISEGNKYGSYDPNTKSWNGIIKDLLDHKAHLGICDLTITRERRQAVDFSLPFMSLGISILYKRNTGDEESKIFAFMQPFSIELWFYMATFYLCITILIFILSRIQPDEWENPHPCDENPEELENIWEIKNSMWLTMGMIMTQGCDILPKGFSTRMSVTMWGFFALIITSSYTANLAAFLTKQQNGPNIDNAEALSKSKIKFGVVDGGSTQTFFRTSNFSLYKRMWLQMEQFKPSVFEKDNAEGVKRVLNSNGGMYAFFMENTGIEYEVERNCSLKAVGDTLDSKGYGIAMPLGAPYRHLINKAILKLQEDGVLGELKKKWWKKKFGGGACDEMPEEKEDDQKLGLKNVGGVFLVLGLGLAMGLITSIIEFLWNVRDISVEENMSFWEAFKMEAKFASNIWIDKKATNPQKSENDSLASTSTKKSETNKSLLDKHHIILNGTASLINLKNDSENS